VQFKLKKYKEAIEDFNKSIIYDQKDKNSYYNRGFIKYLIEDYEGAIVDFNEAISLDNKSGKAFYWLGMTYVKQNKFNEGCLNLEKASELSFEDALLALKEYCKNPKETIITD
jgi:tetratricopeptide (TPR) repeat protein